jgi:transcriptional regulator with GAF, ATPase, and Fis domain
LRYDSRLPPWKHLSINVNRRRASCSGVTRQYNNWLKMPFYSPRLDELSRLLWKLIKVYEQFTQEVRKLVHFDRMSINTIDQEARVFTIKYLVGQEVAERYLGSVRTIAGSQTAHMLATGHTIVREDLDNSQKFAIDAAFLGEGLRSAIMVPLISKCKIIGSLSLRSRRVAVYGLREQSILERLADQIILLLRTPSFTTGPGKRKRH